jgi:hypothetical protein
MCREMTALLEAVLTAVFGTCSPVTTSLLIVLFKLCVVDFHGAKGKRLQKESKYNSRLLSVYFV